MNERIGVRFEKLEVIRRGVESRIDGLAPESLNRQPEPGRWSVAQVISHIVLAETRTVGYVSKKRSDPSQLRPARLKQKLMAKLIVAAMNAPFSFRAPEVVATVPDNSDPGELRAQWARVRAELASLLDSIPDSLLGTCLFKHPYAGPMTLEAALDFMVAHASRHARQIERILSADVRR
ncbi:MAG: DinB family protein [Thermoanaerobaculia bacterium]|jgi:uncharacterized damage-inducible protein DinB